MKVLLIILSLSFFCFDIVDSQIVRRLSSTQSVQQALDSNLYVQSVSMSLSADKASVGTSFNIPKSEIGFSYGNVSSAAVDNSLSFSQSFLFPSVYFNQLKLSKAKALAGEYRLKDAQLQLSAKVKRLYWKIVYCKALNSLLISEDSLLSSVVIATQSRVSSGDAASLDLMSARSLQMETKNKQKKNEVDIDILTDEFKSLLNISFPFLLNDSVLVPLPFDSLPTDSLIHNPLWALSSQQTKISEYERLVVRSKIYPDISVGFTSQTYKDLKDFSIGRRFYSVQLGLSFPCFVVVLSLTIRSPRLVSGKLRLSPMILSARLVLPIIHSWLSVLDSITRFYIISNLPSPMPMLSFNNPDSLMNKEIYLMPTIC
jgi:cobalt-zinc-cadmium resistance protein CzcA